MPSTASNRQSIRKLHDQISVLTDRLNPAPNVTTILACQELVDLLGLYACQAALRQRHVQHRPVLARSRLFVFIREFTKWSDEELQARDPVGYELVLEARARQKPLALQFWQEPLPE